jgi:signal transduction histidine kinase
MVTGDRFTVAQVVAADGRIVASSTPALATTRIADLPGAGERGVTLRQLPAGPAGRHRVAAVAATGPDGPLDVYVATSLEPADHAVKVWTIRLLAVLPLVVVVVGLITWWGMGRALGPVEAMRVELASIGAGDRRRRVQVPSGTAEIVRLGTTMNELLDRLAAAAERQRQFTADASHELRSPLAAMRVQLEGALARPDLADWPTTAQDVLTDQTRVEALVRDLLLLARLQGAEAHHEELDLTAVVVDELDRSSVVSRPLVRRRLDGSCRVRGDAEQLGRLVRNLVDNAERHASRHVDIRARADERDVVLEVVDDGPGIAPADRERIFARFVRLDDARTRDAGGAGLGLAIVREIVAAHAGSVRVADHPVGACFEVRLPRWP